MTAKSEIKTHGHDYETARLMALKLNRAGFEAYIVGGAVRDLMLDKHPKDFDLATDARPEQIQAIRGLDRARYKDTAQAYGVSRVMFRGRELEIATFRRDVEAHLGRKRTKVEFTHLQEDIRRRDFTINALALDPITNQVIDYVDGIDDINNRLIRFIGDPLERIHEDPLRVLRAIRFKNVLDFNYAPQTKKALRTVVQSGVIKTVAVDRLRQEINAMLIHSSRRNSLEDLDDFGILSQILPEVVAGKGVEQPPQFHAEGDVWAHQLLVMESLPQNPSKQLAWAALLHDIGKAQTQSLPSSAEDRIRFNRHYEVGADMARKILNRLHFSKRDIDLICWIIYHHINIDDLPQMRPSHQQKMLGHPAFADLFELHKVDAVASWPGGKPKSMPRFKEIEDIWRQYLKRPPEKRQPSLKQDLGIDGNWLLSLFGDELALQPGRLIGKVLRDLEEVYQDKGIKDKSFYQRRAKRLIKLAR